MLCAKFKRFLKFADFLKLFAEHVKHGLIIKNQGRIFSHIRMNFFNQLYVNFIVQYGFILRSNSCFVTKKNLIVVAITGNDYAMSAIGKEFLH